MSELEATRRALEEAVAHASGAAELARLLEDYRRRLEQASREEAEAKARLREAEERLKLSERHLAKLAKSLAEQRYQTEVAQWKLESVRESRWLRLGERRGHGRT
jgi:phytoene/squalene synthetase